MEIQKLRNIIMTEAARCFQGRHDSETTVQLIKLLSDAGKRNLVYTCCLELAEDRDRRPRIMVLLITYVHGFPPSIRCLRSIRDFCQNYNAVDTYQDLLKIIDSLLSESPLRGVIPAAESNAATHTYVAEFSLQTRVARSKTSIPIPALTSEKLVSVAMRKNEDGKGLKDLSYRRTWCSAYIEQFPLSCSEASVERQAAVLSQFWADYKTRPVVVQATLFFIKQMCDGYVSKLHLSNAFLHFRSITICYLPMLLEMMESDYLCVRNQVYDFLFNLGVHMQLVDPAGVHSGCTEALELELVWLFLNVAQRQAVLKISDDTTWTAAAKCMLAIIPERYRHLVDCCAIRHILQLSGLWEVHPDAFAVFVEAFVRSLLSNKDVGVKPEDNLQLDETEFSKLGCSAIADILMVYRRCVTIGGRLAMFQLLFVLAARSASLPIEDRPEAYCTLVSIDFFWYISPLLYHLSRKEVVEILPRGVIDRYLKVHNANYSTSRRYWDAIYPVVVRMLEMIGEDAKLSDFMQQRCKAMENMRRSGDVSGVKAALEDIADTVPLLLENQREATDSRVYNWAWRTAFVGLRWSALCLPEDGHIDVTQRMAQNLVMYKDQRGQARNRARIGKLCTDVLLSLAALCRISPAQSQLSFSTMLEVVLFDREDAIDTRTAMALYHHLIEYLCTKPHRKYSLHSSPKNADVAALVIKVKSLRISTGAARLLGQRVIWGMYRSLVQSQEAAVCRARHTLVLLLSYICTERRSVEVRTWKTVLADAYPPVAQLAAERILYLLRVEEKGITAVDVSDSARDSYQEALKGVERSLKKRPY